MSHIPDTSVLSRISSLIAEIDGEEKTAGANGNGSTKRAETELGLSGSAKKDPGGYQGGSSHPSAKVESGLQSTPLGARAKENEKDVKEDHPGAGVDHTNPGAGGDQDAHQIESGTKQRATGEDPEAEDEYKSDKDDPGTDHPANAEEVGEKYSSMQFGPLCKMAYARMNEILADIANGQFMIEPASDQQPPAQQQKQAGQQPPKQPADPAQTAAQAGYDLAGAVGQDADMEKLAFAHMMTSQIIADAQTDADLVGEYLYKFAANRAALLKHAEGDPTAADATGGPPPMDSAMAAGGPPPGMDAGAMGGGPPPGPPPGGADAGGDGGGGGNEDAVNELCNALVELGATPEEIIAHMQAAQGGGAPGGADAGGGGMPPGGDMPPGGGDMPPGAGEKAGSTRRGRVAEEDRQALLKLAHACYTHQRSGKMRLKEAREGSRQRHERNEVKDYIREVCGIR